MTRARFCSCDRFVWKWRWKGTKSFKFGKDIVY